MINIIKYGKIPAQHKEITCHYCNTIFSYDQEDIECEDRPCAMPHVVCPLCGKHNNTMPPKPDIKPPAQKPYMHF